MEENGRRTHDEVEIEIHREDEIRKTMKYTIQL